MSAFYDQASLVMVPSGYKDGKLYSQKPLSTSGELAFSRGSDIEATRIGGDGLIHKAQVNLLLQSNSFSTTWASSSTTETGGQAGYDGTSDAWLLDKSAASGNVNQNISVSGVNTFSVYVKAGSESWVALLAAGPNAGKFFNLSAGTIGTNLVNAPLDASIESVGGGWYRISITTNGSVTQVRIYPAEGDGVSSGTSGNIYIQDAQLNYGLVAQTYQETTTAAVVSGITDDMPRLNYDPANPTCPHLILEPSRTNLVTQSEYIADSSWLDTDLTITSNYGISPEGVQNSSRLVLTNLTSSRIAIAPTLVDGTTYTFSCYYKGTAGEKLYMEGNGSGGSGTQVSKLITFTGDWQREELQFVGGSTANLAYIVDTRNGTEDTAQDFEVYGAQLESGSYPTSYIPTYGSSATRTGDMVGKSSFPTSILNTTTAHSGFFELKPNAIETAGYQVFGFDDGTYTSYIKIYADTTGRHRMAAASGGSSGVSAWGVANQYNKFAWSYDGAGNVKFFCNGVASVNYSITLNAMTEFGAGEKSLQVIYTSQSLKQILLFNSKLTDAQLAELTTL